MPREIACHEPQPPVMKDTMAEVARAIGVNHQTITNHQHKPGFPKPSRKGKWNSRSIYQYFVDYNKITMGTEKKKVAEYKEEAHARLIAARADKTELELLQAQRKLFTDASVRNAFAEVGANLASKLNVLPVNLARMLEGKTCGQMETIIREQLTLLIDEFSRDCGEQVAMINCVED